MLHRVLAIRTVVSRNMDQAVGMDFPLARIVAIFLLLCRLLATGALLGSAGTIQGTHQFFLPS